jgi:hypothetical protein
LDSSSLSLSSLCVNNPLPKPDVRAFTLHSPPHSSPSGHSERQKRRVLKMVGSQIEALSRHYNPNRLYSQQDRLPLEKNSLSEEEFEAHEQKKPQNDQSADQGIHNTALENETELEI